MNEQATLMNNKVAIFASVLTVLVIGIIGGYFFLVNTKTGDNKIDLVNEVKLPTSLTFLPASIDLSNNQIFFSSINITSENVVTGIDIELVYDPSAVQLKKLNPISLLGRFIDSSNWQVIRNEINNKEGKARFVAFTVNRNYGISEKTGILEVEGIVNRLGGGEIESYTIDYGVVTAVSALNKGYDVLTDKNPLTLNIFEK